MSNPALTIRLGLSGLASVEAGLGKLRSSVSSVGNTVKSLAAFSTGLVGISIGLAGVGQALKSIVGTNAGIEQQTTAFKTLLGSADAAEKRIRALTKFAAETPFELPEVVQASKVLQSLTNGALATGEGLRIVGDAAAATGRPLDETSMWIGRLYAGLDSGTPVGEATLRLVEMGLISGTTARELNRVAQSGEGVGSALKIVKATFAGTSGAMVEQSQTLTGLFSTLKDTVSMTLADVGMPIFESVKDAVRAAIPLAESFGDFVRLAKQSWQKGQFAEFVGLTIEAGWELGRLGAWKVWNSLKDMVSSSAVWETIGNYIVTSIAEASKVVVGLILDLSIPFGAVADYASDALTYGFKKAANALAGALEYVINDSSKWANEKFGTSFGKVSFARENPVAPDFGKSMDVAKGGAGYAKELAGAGIDEVKNSFREMIGLKSDAFGAPETSAWEKLKSAVNAVGDARKAAAATATEETRNTTTQINTAAILARLKKDEEAAQLRVRDLGRQISEVEGNFAITDADKYTKRKELLAAQRAELERIVGLMRERASMDGIDPQTREQILGRADKFSEQAAGIDTKSGGMGADPNSMRDQMAAATTDLENQFGTTAQAVARSFKDVIGTAVDSVSGGLQKLIGDTEYWSSKLGKIAGPIMGAITGAISRMFTEWIAKRALAAAKNMFFSTQEGVTDAAAKAPGAVLSSISSFGVAAAVGVAAVIAAMAAFGGFQSGGYTGGGGVSDVAGVVHGREFVFDAAATDRIGVPNLEAMRSGDVAPMGGGSGSGSTSINLATFDTRQDASKWARSQDAEVWFVDMSKRTATPFRR